MDTQTNIPPDPQKQIQPLAKKWYQRKEVVIIAALVVVAGIIVLLALQKKSDTQLNIAPSSENQTINDKEKQPLQGDYRYITCDEEWNYDPPTKWVEYMSKEKGISFKVPYNPNWGNKKYFLNPYEEVFNDVNYGDRVYFGNLQDNDYLCTRDVLYLSVKLFQSREQIVKDLSQPMADVTIEPITKINNLEIVETTSNSGCGQQQVIEVLGTKYNYIFSNHCGKNKNDMRMLEEVVKTAKLTLPQTTQDPVAEYEHESKKLIEDAVKVLQEANSKLPQTLFQTYSGLSQLKENNDTIQSYAGMAFESLSGNSELYTLTTFSKKIEDINNFSGALGTKNTIFFLCSKISKSCQQTNMIEQAIKAGQPGYFIGLGFCVQGWDDINKRIFSYSCGEGGDGATFGQYNYGTGKSYIVGGDGSLYLDINKQLTRFAIERMDNKNKPIAIDLYTTDSPVHPDKTIDLTKLTNSLTVELLNFEWDKLDGDIGYFVYQNKHYLLNARTGEIIIK